MAQIKWFAVALAAVAAPTFAMENVIARVGEVVALSLLGGTGPDQDKPADHYFVHNDGVQKGGAIQSCGSDDIGQRYPGFTQTYCRVSPNSEFSPQHTVRKDKAGS